MAAPHRQETPNSRTAHTPADALLFAAEQLNSASEPGSFFFASSRQPPNSSLSST